MPNRRVVSLRVPSSLHFAAKSAGLYLGHTVEQVYADALRFYLLHHCPKILQLLGRELQPPLSNEEKAIIEQSLLNKS